ncbi:MAG: aminopeptidase P family protein [Pseudomonadota bacterium]
MFQVFERRGSSAESAERIAAVRRALAASGVSAFLVPRRDAHNGETVAPCDERLAWLTGFTGSAGLAVVTASEAALFVDGRYTLQAASEIDTDAVTIVPSQETSPADWLKGRLSVGERLAIDPWLHPPAEVERYAKALGEMPMLLDTNPIDAAWTDRPPRPAAAITNHPLELAGEKASEKIARLAKALRDDDMVAAVLSLPDNIAWLLNIRGSDIARSPVTLSFAILGADERVMLFLQDPESQMSAATLDAIGGAVSLHEMSGLLAALDGTGNEVPLLSGKKVRIDRDSCPVALVGALERGGAVPDLGRDPCTLPKAIKNAAELEGMRKAHRRDGAAVCGFLAALDRDLKAGKRLSEIDVARRIEQARRDTRALVDLSFDTISGSGPNGAIVHYRVTTDTDRAITPGEVLLVDSGGQYRDGTTDITRTLATGAGGDGGAHPAAIRAFTLVLKGMIALSLARWPKGLAGRDLDPLARAALWRAGLDYDHGTGHGVGAYLNVHEGPAGIARRSGDVALRPGMILSNEPGCYRQGAWGIRIENLVAVVEPSVPVGGDRAMLGFETLTLAPIDRRLIDIALLDADEIAWLDAYHARVRAEIEPLVAQDPETAAWLADACAKLG